MALSTPSKPSPMPTAHRMSTCASIFTSFLCYYAFRWTVSAKDFPHIYNGINLRKTPPTVATEGRRTLILLNLSF